MKKYLKIAENEQHKIKHLYKNIHKENISKRKINYKTCKERSGCNNQEFKIRNSKDWTVIWHCRFMISKKAFLYSFWVNGYVYIYLHPHINLAIVERHLGEWSCFQCVFFTLHCSSWKLQHEQDGVRKAGGVI